LARFRDPTVDRTLSKSDFSVARTCDAKLFFRENGYSDNRSRDAYLQLLAEGGYMVEALATAKRPGGIELEYGDPAAGFAATLELLKRDRVTLFQATLLWNRRLVRVDILEKEGNVARLIEVKAKSFDGEEHAASLRDGGKGVFRGVKKPYRIKEDWRQKLEDVTYQTIVLQNLFPNLTVRPRLVLVDKSKRSDIDDLPRLFEIVRKEGRDGVKRLHTARFVGTPEQLAAIDLVTEVDVGEEVAMLRDEVDEAARRYELMLDAAFDPALASLGAKCRDCEFAPEGFDECWGDMAHVEPRMLDLHKIGMAKDTDGTPLAERLAAAGKASLFDVPLDKLAKKDGTIGPLAARQRIQITSTMKNEMWIGPGLATRIADLSYPLHFVDFEVSRLAIPYHAGMRPYGQVVFQWSCHTVDHPGAAPRHSEWLNTNDLWPNRDFTEALRAAVGDSGPILTWSKFERSTLREIGRELEHFGGADPALAAWMVDVCDNRIVDLHEWALAEFFHPAMGGRTSIKVVLDGLWKSDPTMREQFTLWTGLEGSAQLGPYHALPALEINGVEQDVREGTGAIRAYEALMYGVEREDAAAKAAWAELLKQYCKLDTLSMVLVFEFWRRATNNASVPQYAPAAAPASPGIPS
jgi:hypothetical protein